MTCPFCNDDDFDAPGLKHHLSAGLCSKYNGTPGLTRLPRRMAVTLSPADKAALLSPDGHDPDGMETTRG